VRYQLRQTVGARSHRPNDGGIIQQRTYFSCSRLASSRSNILANRSAGKMPSGADALETEARTAMLEKLTGMLRRSIGRQWRATGAEIVV